MENAIEVKNLNKSYYGFELKNINITVPKGKIIGLIGENGSGKTTTIKAILNLISINSGTIKVFGKDINKLPSKMKEEIGIVLDDSFLSNQYYLEDINKIMKRFYKNWNEKQYFSYIKRYKLPLNKILKEFSSGMKMKVKLICALSHNPKLLILDEPTNGLDPVFRYEILDLLASEVSQNNLSILISTHITTDLEHIADEIIFINDGEILLNKSKKELFDTLKIAKCDKDDFEKIDKKYYTKYLKYKDDYMLLLKDKDKFREKYNYEIRNNSLEELMLMFIKGVDSDE
jgi:ABC-2 type transport system ATP-binding protein